MIKEITQKFFNKVEKSKGGCWIWTGGYRAPGGVGRFETGNRRLGTRRTHSASRVSYSIHKTEDITDKLVFSNCNNSKCVNPDHLYTVPRSHPEGEMITFTELMYLVTYDPETGIMTRSEKANGKWKEGENIGSDSDGYLNCSIKNRVYKVHVLAWMYMTGEYPRGDIDHINHIKSDNRFSNLRLVTKIENSHNLEMSKANTSGYTGVSWNKAKNKWRARIKVNKKERFLGYFEDIEDAKKAWDEARKEHGFHKNHGRRLR